MESDVAGGVASDVAFGLVGGLVFGLASNMANGVASDVASCVMFGAAVGVIVGVMDSVVFGVMVGVMDGVITGVAVSVASILGYFRFITYPINAALSTTAYFKANRNPQTAFRAWRWCPISWNEVIWLPLPYLSDLLVLMTKQHREEGFRQIAFVAAERTLQRRAVLSALAEIAVSDLQAKTPQELASISETLKWTTNAPAELPKELTEALPQFDRIAQQVGQSIELRSQNRKRKALDQALSELQSLQKSLIVTRGKLVPRLLQVANEWQALIKASRQALQSDIEARGEIPNPFVFGTPVTESEYNVFTGRQDIVGHIEESLLNAANLPTLLLFGPRRMGKTSILNQLPRLLGPDFAPAMVDCQAPAVRESANALLRYISEAMSEALQRRRILIDPLSVEALKSEPFGFFEKWLTNVEKALPEQMRVLLCLDEYERLQTALDAGWGADVLDLLRNTFQHRRRIAMMFTGAHRFAELGPAWTDRFISARNIRVSFLKPDEVVPLLTKPIPDFDMTYADGALEGIISATNGQPFLIQGIGFELVQFMNEGKRKQATIADVEEAISRTLSSGDAYFFNVWSDAGEDGQAILQAIATSSPVPNFPKAMRWLKDHDVLTTEGRFAVPIVERWVKTI
ncbi:MAG: hypothetical protein HY774_19170 [Acidobacteria bacterium]|nr:hypothetical protein [Acidobacteriota bacterium]